MGRGATKRGGGGVQVKFYPYEQGGGGSFSHAEGGGTQKVYLKKKIRIHYGWIQAQGDECVCVGGGGGVAAAKNVGIWGKKDEVYFWITVSRSQHATQLMYKLN